MNDYDSEQGRELRRARLTRIRPRAADDLYPKEVFKREYRDFHMVRRECMPEVEENQQVMFCPACQEQEDDELVAARKLHVSYNEDPLRNYRALVTVACKGCGWSEIIPVAAPEAPSEEELSLLREKAKYEAQDKMEQMRAQMGVYNSALGLGQQSQFQNVSRQMAKQAAMAQMYGAGPSVMKALLGGMNIKIDTRTPTRGQALADAVWQDYAEIDRMREEAKQARSFVDAHKVREQVMKDMAEQIARKVDEDILSELKKVPAPPIKGHGKGRVTAPPPPVFPGGATPKELRDAIMAAPAEVRPSLLEKMKAYFR